MNQELLKFIERVDTEIGKRLPAARKIALGVARTYFDANNNPRHYILNKRHKEDATQVIFDDRFDILWFHKIEAGSTEFSSNTSYGRGNRNLGVRFRAVTIFYVRRDAVGFKSAEEVNFNEFDLTKLLVSLTKYLPTLTYRDFDYNTPAIEREEFGTNRIHAEAFLVAARWEAIIYVNECINDEICVDNNFNCCVE